MIQRNLHINKRAHSTETAFVRISNDILQTIDNKCMILASLDLSAAFDTVDHGTLVYRSKNIYGVSHNSLRWCTSYLENRSVNVCVNGSFSYSHSLIAAWCPTRICDWGPILHHVLISGVKNCERSQSELSPLR